MSQYSLRNLQWVLLHQVLQKFREKSKCTWRQLSFNTVIHNINKDKIVYVCPSLLSIAIISTMTKSSLGEKMVYFSAHFLITAHHQGTTGKELKAGTGRQKPWRNAAQ